MLLQFIFRHLVHVYWVSSVASDNGGPLRLNRGLKQNVCVVQYIKLSVFYLLYHCTEIGIFFSSIFGKNYLLYRFLVIESYHIVSL